MGWHEGEHRAPGKSANDLIQPSKCWKLPACALVGACRISGNQGLNLVGSGFSPEIVPDFDGVIGALGRGKYLVAVREDGGIRGLAQPQAAAC